MSEQDQAPAPTFQFRTATPIEPGAGAAGAWHEVRRVPKPASDVRAPQSDALERGVSVVTSPAEAPPRTRHAASIVKSSPLSSSVRAMLESRELTTRFDATEIDVGPIAERLPGLACPAGDVVFLASDRSLEELSLSMDALLQHRKRLLAPSVDRAKPRRAVLVLGAGPGGLMTAIDLALRDHAVVVCEQRDVYTRNRFIGVYKEIAHRMAALGMPESMTYDFTHYRGKRGIMLADIQTFLHAVALKLGVVIYTGATARDLSREVLGRRELALHRSTRGVAGAGGASSIGITRWHHDTVGTVRSGVVIRFDTIVEATGGRSGLRELCVGADKVVSLRVVARAAAARDPSLASFFDDPEDHCAEFVESDYGCPPGLRADFAAALLRGGDDAIPDELPCFVSNIDASVLTQPIRANDKMAGVGARIGDKDLAIPPDWVVVECPLPDRRLTRYQIEGPLPRTFGFAGARLSTRDSLEKLNPVTFLVRVLYAMGVPFDAVDRARLVDFYAVESSYGDASDVVATWNGRFQSLALGEPGQPPLWCGAVPGAPDVEYAIVGEALQNAWYRFGVGVDDTFRGAEVFAAGIDLAADARLAAARALERVMTARSVQILYHLYAVAKHGDQGVVGPVLTEYHLEERRGEGRAEGRLRDEARFGAEMAASAADVRPLGDALLDAAIGHALEQCCRRALALLGAFPYDAALVRRASHALRGGAADRRARAWEAIGGALSDGHRELLRPLFERAEPDASARARIDERLVELAMGRYAWASGWIRACALRALPASAAGAEDALAAAAGDRDALVREAAAEKRAAPAGGPRTIEKVLLLKDVGLFAAIPHEELVGVAAHDLVRRLAAGEPVFDNGGHGACRYLIAGGRLRVHDGEATFRHLGPHQFFGELSLLDAEPRSASVTAVEPTHLFRLGQDDFYALIQERPEMVHAINRVLCAMVRRAPPPS